MLNKIKCTLSTIAIVIFSVCFFSGNAQSQNTEILLIYGKHSSYDRFVFEYKDKPQYSISSNENYTTIYFPIETKLLEEEKSISKYPRKALLEKTTENGVLSFIIPAQMIKKFEYKNKIVIDVISYKNIKDNLQNKTSESKTNNTQKDPKIEKKEVDKNSKNTSLRFTWNKDVGLAAFERGENIWLVFDELGEWDLSYMNAQHDDFISNIVQIPSTNITALILTTKRLFDVNISKEGYNWIVTLSEPKEEKNKKSLKALVQNNENGAYLYVPTTNVKNVIMTLDPNTGDILMIAPVNEPNLNYKDAYKYIDLKLLQTYQGFAIEAYTDDLIITKESKGLVINALNRGLNISPNLEDLKKQKTKTK